MKRTGVLVITVLAATILLLLFVDVRIARMVDNVESQQSVARSQGGQAALGTKLQVYLAGDLSLAQELKEQLPEALRAKGLPIEAVLFVDEVPADAHGNPFLAVHLTNERRLWTPVYATRTLTASMFYAHGRPVRPADVLSPTGDGALLVITEENCSGECTEARRSVTLNATSTGLVSLPSMRAYTAQKVAQEAATLVAAGVPDHMNPDRWMDRAGALAWERLSPQPGGTLTSFNRLPGCQGGIVLVAGIGRGADWHLMYYDASRDLLTETVTRSEVQTRLPGASLRDTPALGVSATDQAVSVILGDATLSVPAGTCSLSGWQVRRN